MMISRRAFSAGWVAGTACTLVPLPCLSQSISSLPLSNGARRDPTLDDPWLIRSINGAPNFVLHEPTALIFKPDFSQTLVSAGVWANYAPPYPLVARDARGALLQIAPPAKKPYGYAPNPDEILSAARRIAIMSQAQARTGDVWLLARPKLAGGIAFVPVQKSGFAGPEALNFPKELRANFSVSTTESESRIWLRMRIK